MNGERLLDDFRAIGLRFGFGPTTLIDPHITAALVQLFGNPLTAGQVTSPPFDALYVEPHHGDRGVALYAKFNAVLPAEFQRPFGEHSSSNTVASVLEEMERLYQ